MSEKPNKRANYIASAIFNLILLWVVNKIPDWNIIFITDKFVAVLWALNLSIAVQIAANFMLIFYNPLFLHYLAETGIALVSLIAVFVLYTVFPFDFSFVGDWLNLIVKIALLIGVIGTGITAIVNLVRFFKALKTETGNIEEESE